MVSPTLTYWSQSSAEAQVEALNSDLTFEQRSCLPPVVTWSNVNMLLCIHVFPPHSRERRLFHIHIDTEQIISNLQSYVAFTRSFEKEIK